MEKLKETYLGDGVMAGFDGYNFRLRLDGTDHRPIYLDPAVVDQFMAYVKRTRTGLVDGIFKQEDFIDGR